MEAGGGILHPVIPPSILLLLPDWFPPSGLSRSRRSRRWWGGEELALRRHDSQMRNKDLLLPRPFQTSSWENDSPEPKALVKVWLLRNTGPSVIPPSLAEADAESARLCAAR